MALLAEALISLVLMTVILLATNTPRLARLTGVLAGLLLALFITVEAPFSGTSMNPARSLASALPAGLWQAFWIYLVGPPAGMLLAVDALPGAPALARGRLRQARPPHPPPLHLPLRLRPRRVLTHARHGRRDRGRLRRRRRRGGLPAGQARPLRPDAREGRAPAARRQHALGPRGVQARQVQEQGALARRQGPELRAERVLQRRRQDQVVRRRAAPLLAARVPGRPGPPLPRLAVRPRGDGALLRRGGAPAARQPLRQRARAAAPGRPHLPPGPELALRAAAPGPQARDPGERRGGQALRRLRLGRGLQGRRRARPDREDRRRPELQAARQEEGGRPAARRGPAGAGRGRGLPGRQLLPGQARDPGRGRHDLAAHPPGPHEGDGPGRAPALRAGGGRQLQAPHQQRAPRLLALQPPRRAAQDGDLPQRRPPAHHGPVPGLARRRPAGDAAPGRGAEVPHQRRGRPRLRLLRHHRGRLEPG